MESVGDKTRYIWSLFQVLDRLKKKQSSLVGAFMYTHGQSIQDIEKTILDARNALTEVSKDLHERSMRWKQVECDQIWHFRFCKSSQIWCDETN